jgi:hypothetical protein
MRDIRPVRIGKIEYRTTYFLIAGIHMLCRFYRIFFSPQCCQSGLTVGFYRLSSLLFSYILRFVPGEEEKVFIV